MNIPDFVPQNVPQTLPKTQKCMNIYAFMQRKTSIYTLFLHKYSFLVGRGGFEPPKSKTSDLQSDPFGRSGICPYIKCSLLRCGAGDWTRTHNLLITNQLLCQLSYTGIVGWDYSLRCTLWVVPWGGIEPPTGRFSVCCSTD